MVNTTDLIRALRTVYGLTQTEIARRTGIPQPRLSRWEAQAPATADDVLKLQRLHDELSAGIKQAA